MSPCVIYISSLLSGKNFRAKMGRKVPLGLANSSLAAFQEFFGQAIGLPIETDFALGRFKVYDPIEIKDCFFLFIADKVQTANASGNFIFPVGKK